ncbi:AraC family transcriptional regulator [Methanimicrococcus blatticola]|uniref:AraC-like DNA-binding protein n=1 Tax=Methanimicrococcus blatticola TaxID=91560 RepID=A0A484F609_9EURY|nr:AraC family transcriptional regulator [Methanimicrococcus blatticola]MBZ3935136.1 AraC family transcriptional regulator [Methanimicrococcus blatticola]MCC2508767.1 AraC family transcriptional regulator [Methanimicrococcus blatticola]TDQ71199.1 AraC-like DNA-binding protein [Methanimicrococcus blatticola]
MTDKNLDFISEIVNRNEGNLFHPSKHVPGKYYLDQIREIPDDILIYFKTFNIGQLKDLHYHDHFELTYLESGRCSQTINGKTIPMKPGDICLLGPSDSHSFAVEEDNTLMFVVIIKKSLFEGSFMYLMEDTLLRNYFYNSLFQSETSQTFLSFPHSDSSNVDLLIHFLIFEYFEKGLYYSTTVECYLSLLFVELARYHQKMLEQSVVGDSQLVEILVYIHKNKSDITLNSVAEKFDYNPNYLSSIIKQNTGKTFSEILLTSRMDEAAYLLKNTDMSVDKISQRVGFYDKSHMHRAFRKKFEMTPTAYRQTHSHSPESGTKPENEPEN